MAPLPLRFLARSSAATLFTALAIACGSASSDSPSPDGGTSGSHDAGTTSTTFDSGTTPTGTSGDAGGASGEGGTSSEAGAPGPSPVTMTTGTVWYVRLDGGTATQCDGRTDAAYTGNGSDAGPQQHCAFSNPYYLWGNDLTYGEKPTWKIAGGDSVIFKGGPFRMGYKGPNDSDYWAQCPGNPYGCEMPTVPSGTAGETTKLLGENFASCSSKTQLFGGYGLSTVLPLNGAKYVDVACLELTDHTQCNKTSSTEHCSTSYPLDDYSDNGITTDVDTANLGLYDLDIHGFTSRAIIGPIGGLVTVDRVRGAYNAGAGWDFDDGNGTMSAAGAQVNATALAIEWNGCIEEYPIVDALPAHRCWDQSDEGYGDGVGTPNTGLNFTCDHCLFDHNTQDGLDLLHTSGSTIQVTHSLSYANMGQQWKMGAMQNVLFQNNETVHNCNRMSAAIPGAPASYNQGLSLFCRANGDGFAFSMTDTSTYTFQNNTFVGYGTVSYDIGCSGSDCSGAKLIFENNIDLGYPNPLNGNTPPALFYGESGVAAMPFTTRDHNIAYGFHTDQCPTGFTAETCASPQLMNQPTFTSEASLDDFDFHLATTSPAIGAGTPLATVTDDYSGTARPQGAYDIGANQP
jgi:hypothetical protein